MDSKKRPTGICRRYPIALLILSLAGSLIGCGTTATPTATPPTFIESSPTAVPTTPAIATPSATQLIGTPTPNATIAYLENKAGAPLGSFSNPTIVAAVTAAAMQYDATQTAVALTPTETRGPSVTPVPTRTPGVGLISDDHCIRAFHGGAPRFPNCWEAQVNGAWVLIGGGQRGIDGYLDDPLRSVILVCAQPCGLGPDEGTIYETPRNVREVRVAAVNGTLVTFVPRDPAIQDRFVFDLATRQWLPTTPGPEPSATP